MLTREQLQEIHSRTDLIAVAEQSGLKLKKHLRHHRYEAELAALQAQLVNLMHWIEQEGMRLAIIFEGRDAAGKGGSIKRFVEHLNPRSTRIVALAKPTEVERGQWYFRRYIKELPNPGQIVFFDRSWYNRAVVEPVMGFCTKPEYRRFMAQVTEFEHMLYEDGVHLVKFWFDISRKEQQKRFDGRLENPLKQWKFSPVDLRGQELWGDYTTYKERMFAKTHTPFSPWTIVDTDDKRVARLESMRHVLSLFDYPGRDQAQVELLPDPNVVRRYFRRGLAEER